jgi:ribosomal protein S18 acetylase RimI-like enzyme
MDELAIIRAVETLYLHVDVENIAALTLYESVGYEILNPKERMYVEFMKRMKILIRSR